MTAQELITLAQRHIRSLTATIDRLNEIGAQDELRSIGRCHRPLGRRS
jgi:hypothetical protein